MLISESSPAGTLAELAGVARPRENRQTEEPRMAGQQGSRYKPCGTVAAGVNLDLPPRNLRIEASGMKQHLLLSGSKRSCQKEQNNFGLVIVALEESWTPFP